MADNENSTEPPVPPRRTKRKIKIAPIEPLASKTATETTNDIAISQQKRPPPPPPPPSLPEKCQRNNFGYLENHQPQCDTVANCPRVKSEQHHCKSRVIGTTSDIIEAKPYDNTTFARDNSTSKSADDLIPKPILSKPFLSYVASKKAVDKYPSLFFTLHDFENVVSDTWSRNDSVNSEDSQNLYKEELSKAHMLDDDGDVCFRVTTTNLPFQKCLDSWKDPLDDGDFVRKFDDCRFEDSTNENDRINHKRLFDHDVFDNNNDDSKCRIGTKVRFVIESPNSSPSKRDSDVKSGVPCNSSQSYESILDDDEQAGEQSASISVKLTEIREEFTDVKNCDDMRDKSYTSSVEKGNFAMGEDDPFIPADANKVDAKLKTIPTYCDDRNNVNREKICEDSDLTSWNVQASDEILETGKENIITLVIEKTIISKEYDPKQMDQGNTSSEVSENVHCFTDKSLETAYRIEEAAKITQKIHEEETMFLRKKKSDDIKKKCVAKNENIFFDESPQNFLDKYNDDESHKNISTDDFISQFVQIEQTRRFPKENEEENNSSVDSKNNHEIVSPSKDIFVKNVPVKVRRNSFLETMLSDDFTDISMNCAIISATTSTSIDEELSDPNKSLNKKGELETDITTEHLRDFCNATEINTKNQTVLKNSKRMEEKFVKISSVKSTQSENKSASDVKNEVLNELLCNFNNIKLKIVSPENKKSVTKIEDDENISSSIAIDNTISKGKENAFKFEKSRNNVCSVPSNTKAIDVNDDIIVEEIVKEDLMKMKIKERPQDFKNDTSAISEKIAKNKLIEIENKSSCDIKNKIVKDNSKIKIDKTSSENIKSEESSIKTSSEKISEKTKSASESNREHKKSRDIRMLKTILKKTNVECERQQANKFQKRIPIGAPTTMNKIFDSKEFKVTRNNSLENSRKCEKASREIHIRGEEKTDKVIADDEADDDRRKIANRSALALVEDTMSSDDKCAIARKTISVNPCNNNDNNRAVTPVANVSNDQSFRDVVTITPGKVRSFVKYYEIRSDTTTVERHSKINDREKVARRKFTKNQAVPIAARNSQRPEVTKGMKGGDRSVKSNDCDLPRTTSNKIQLSTFAPRILEKPLNNPVCKTTQVESKTKEYEKNSSHMSDKETRALFTKTGAKKSVQFLGGFTVIHSKTLGKDESAGTIVNTLRKRRAPGVPPSQNCDDCDDQKFVREIAKSEILPNVEKDSLQPREAVTQVKRNSTCIV